MSDWLTASGGPGIGEYPKLVAVAFTEDVLEGGNNSEPIEVGDNDAIVVRVEERQAPQPTPLATVRDQIVEELRQRQAVEQAQAKGDELLQKLAEGMKPEDLGDQDYITISQARGVTRSTEDHNPEVVRAAFKLSRPKEGANVDKGFKLNNGDYAVVHLTGVRDADPATMEEAARNQVERGLENMRRSLTVAAMVEDLRARADIVVPEEGE
jgi:peptidyl-prolyl cis-trans isomerase D